jgi:hypothetical protein
MNFAHDELVELLSNIILQKFKDIFNNVFITRVSIDFPKPDFIYIPYGLKENIRDITKYLGQTTLTERPPPLPVSFEVKTPYVSKHEYITGLGQAIAYNSITPLSYLVIPNTNIEGFEVSEFIKGIININNLSIGLFSYKMDNPNNIELVKEAKPIRTSQIAEIARIKRSYSYWRETKPEEVFEALKISKEMEKSGKELSINSVLDRLWKEVLVKRFKNTERVSSFKLNYKLFLIQNSLLDATGRLTVIGRHLLTIGESFGKDSELFKEALTYVMLRYGGHLTLLSKIYNVQKEMDENHLSSFDVWVEEIVNRLKAQNYYVSKEDLNTRLPRYFYAYEKYFCSIAEEFKEGRGVYINYPKILSILEKGSKIFSQIETTLSF